MSEEIQIFSTVLNFFTSEVIL